MTMKSIIIEKHTPYGVVDKEGVMYNFPKSSGLTNKQLPVGSTCNIDMYAYKDKNWIKGLLSKLDAPVNHKSEATDTTSVPKQQTAQQTDKASVPTKYGKPLSDYELLQDCRIGAAGIVQALIGSQIVAQFAPSVDDWKESVKSLAKDLIVFTDEMARNKFNTLK